MSNVKTPNKEIINPNFDEPIQVNNYWVVRETLCPENRGWINHQFPTKEIADKFYQDTQSPDFADPFVFKAKEAMQSVFLCEDDAFDFDCEKAGCDSYKISCHYTTEDIVISFSMNFPKADLEKLLSKNDDLMKVVCLMQGHALKVERGLLRGSFE
jgi:hypothetical protein